MRALAAIVLVLLTSGVTSAQDDPLTEIVLCPDSDNARPYDASQPLAWPSLGPALKDPMASGDFTGAYDEVLRRIEQSTQQLDGALRDRFLTAARASTARSGSGTDCDELRIIKPPFSVTGPAGPHTIFSGDERVELDAECGDRRAVDQGDELRYAANALQNICTARGDPARQKTLRTIVRIDEEFDRFLFEGFPMYPWEAAVNSWWLANGKIEQGPPSNQLVLFHPLPAITLGTDTFRDAEPDLALGVDIVGWVHYLEKSGHTRWWGITAMAGIANDRGTGFGVGLVWGPMRLGAVIYDDDASGNLGDDRASILVGLDLYKYLGEKYRKYESYRNKVHQQLDKLPQ